MKDFTGKTALITGGNGGIGLGIAQGLGVAGADVAIWGRNAEKNESALSVLRSQGVTANSYVVDVSDETSTATAFSQTLEDMKKLTSLLQTQEFREMGPRYIKLRLKSGIGF